MKHLFTFLLCFVFTISSLTSLGQQNLPTSLSDHHNQQNLLSYPTLQYGDTNCDDVVNILDVVNTINHLLGLNPEPFCTHLADLNADGNIDILDAIFIINLILETRDLPCPGTPTLTDADGNVYNTVLIGDQCWMKENLKTTTYSNGTPIEYPGENNAAWQNNTSGAYAWYGNDISWKDSYGALYNWFAVTNINGLCPTGWHAPSDDEWTQLVDYVVSQGYPNTSSDPNGTGSALKSCRKLDSPFGGGCNTSVHPRWDAHSTHSGLDEFGFSALPGGSSTIFNNFLDLGSVGYYWSSTEASFGVWIRDMYHAGSGVGRYSSGKARGYSARCIKDETTAATLPSVITAPVIDIGANSAISGGEVVDHGGAFVSARGLVWSMSELPTLVDNDGYSVDGEGLGTYTSTLFDLTASTTYYARAYATNSEGTAYGEQLAFATTETASFLCGTTTLTDFDGNVYNTVLIGDQCWMAENLKTTTYRNGTPIDYPGDDNTAWQFTTSGAYAWYVNNVNWKESYGGLYNWYATVDPNGLCPEGWHVPTQSEWVTLTDFIGGMPSPNGNKLKSCRQINSPLEDECNTSVHPRWNQHNSHYGTNDYGFSGIPGGRREHNTGFFSELGQYGYWWSSTATDPNHALYRYLHFANGAVYQGSSGFRKASGFSVRCIKDN